ncbi:hypothetical protein LOAG_04321 [Loa loa]|uniref:Uncharacterized protein n=1 Tax=Loa loa TaxID=7209 RepID=A0A1S0U2V7_LOALO|nr:hypothetical protein LOAG_04321 [Loa loa]EFO24158.1 hypothetical protein LOAG_04321 [Loa loa]
MGLIKFDKTTARQINKCHIHRRSGRQDTMQNITVKFKDDPVCKSKEKVGFLLKVAISQTIIYVDVMSIIKVKRLKEKATRRNSGSALRIWIDRMQRRMPAFHLSILFRKLN